MSLIAARSAMVGGGGKLPYDAEVEWLYRTDELLQTIAGPYIDVGFAAGTNVGVEITARDTSDDRLGVMISGSFIRASTGYWGIYNYARNNYKMWGTATKTISISKSLFYTYRSNFQNSQTMDIVQDGTVLYFSALSGSPTFSPDNIWLGLVNKGSYYQYESGSVYISSARYSIGDVIVRDYQPVRFTNEFGQTEGAMYDRANPTVGMNRDGTPRNDGLYLNRGTGSFVIGADK